MNIAHPLKQALTDSGVSGSELARRLGFTRSYVSQLTTGQRGASEEVISAIADALNMKASVSVNFMPIE